MKRRSPSVSRRLGQRSWPSFVKIFLVSVIVLFLVILWRVSTTPPLMREFMVIWGENVRIVSVDPKWQSVVSVTVNKDALIPLAYGYGEYPIASLPELDAIDKRAGDLVTESLSQAFGLPITTYIHSDPAFSHTEDLTDYLQSVFSLGSILDVMKGKIQANVSWRTWVRWVLSARKLRNSEAQNTPIDSVFVRSVRADGSQAYVLDTSRLDYHLESVFQDKGIRREAVTVGFYNTTNEPNLGNKAARALSHVGATVVYIGNEEQAVETCVIKARESITHTITYAFIRKYYQCREEVEKNDDQPVADISIYLGSEYASRFTKQQ